MDIHHTQLYLVRSSLRFARHCTSLLSQSFFCLNTREIDSLHHRFWLSTYFCPVLILALKMCHNTFLCFKSVFCILIVHKCPKVINFSLNPMLARHFPFSRYTPRCPLRCLFCLFPARDPPQTGIFCKMDGFCAYFSLCLPLRQPQLWFFPSAGFFFR